MAASRSQKLRSQKPGKAGPVRFAIEALEDRTLLSAWGAFAQLIGQDKSTSDYPKITGAGESIAILDTGVDYNQPVFGSGGFGTGHKVEAGYDYVSNDGNPFDGNGHGTGLAAAAAGGTFTYDGYQYSGVATGANIIAVRVDDASTTESWSVYANRLIQGLNWVINHRTTYNIVSLNISNGYGDFSSEGVPNDQFSALNDTISADLATLESDGVFIAVSSGNDGQGVGIEYPGTDPSVFAIGATDVNGHIASFSCDGSNLALLAPGENVPLAYYDSTTGKPIFLTGSGTSFAAPMVAGAAALLRQVNPNLTPDQIMGILQATGTSEYDSVTHQTYKLLNLNAAIAGAYATVDDSATNHSFGSAQKLTFNQDSINISGMTLALYASDYYSFALSSASAVKFALSTDGAAAPPFTLYNSHGSQIATLGTSSTLGLSAGTYVLKVTAGSTTMAGTYAIAIQRNADTGNHSMTTALPVAIVDGRGSVAEPNVTAGLSYYDSFSISAPSDVSITAASADAANLPQINLLSPAGKILGTLGGRGLTGRLEKGTYYLQAVAGKTMADPLILNIVETVLQVAPSGGLPATVDATVYEPNGTLDLAYYDSKTQTLKFVQRSANESWGTVTVVDPTSGAGANLSIAYNAALGVPGIAYYASATGDLRYATVEHRHWVVQTIDKLHNVGQNPSLTYTTQGLPLISYYDATAHCLKLAQWDGTAWRIRVLDASANVGRISVIGFDPVAGWAVAYEDSTTGTLKAAQQHGTSWTTAVIDPALTGGVADGGISLAFNKQHLPAVSYFDPANGDLKFAQSNGRRWNVAVVDTVGYTGLSSHLAFSARGQASITYYNGSYNTILNATGTLWDWNVTQVLDDGGSGLSTAISTAGTLTVTFYNSHIGSLDTEDV